MALEWMKSQEKVKGIFDHIGHFLISGAVLYASFYSLSTAQTYRGGVVLGVTAGLMLFAVSLVLFAATFIQGIRRFFPKRKKVPSWIKAVGSTIVIFFYVLCVLQIIDSAYKPDFEIKAKQAKSHEESH